VKRKNQYDFGAQATNLIRRKARQLCGAFSGAEDGDDFEQELAVHLWRQRDKYDPARPDAPGFIARVVHNKAANLVEERRAAKRRAADDPRSQRGDEEDNRSDAEVVDISDFRAAERDRQQRQSRKIDVASALTTLSEKQRDLCRRFTDATVSQVAEDAGRSRSSIYEAIEPLRVHFERAGLQAYLTDGFPRDSVSTKGAGRSRSGK
jgi:RNA polymerase sigma factor (sigma-70 family)